MLLSGMIQMEAVGRAGSVYPLARLIAVVPSQNLSQSLRRRLHALVNGDLLVRGRVRMIEGPTSNRPCGLAAHALTQPAIAWAANQVYFPASLICFCALLNSASFVLSGFSLSIAAMGGPSRAVTSQRVFN